MMSKKRKSRTIKVPRTYNPPGPAPVERPAYLSQAEMAMLRKMTDGRANKGPGGLLSFADDSASSMGVSRGDASQGTTGSGSSPGPNGGSVSNARGGSASAGSPARSGSGGALNSGGMGGGGLAANFGMSMDQASPGYGSTLGGSFGYPASGPSPFSKDNAAQMAAMAAARQQLQGLIGIDPRVGIAPRGLSGLPAGPDPMSGATYVGVDPHIPGAFERATGENITGQQIANPYAAKDQSRVPGSVVGGPQYSQPPQPSIDHGRALADAVANEMAEAMFGMPANPVIAERNMLVGGPLTSVDPTSLSGMPYSGFGPVASAATPNLVSGLPKDQSRISPGLGDADMARRAGPGSTFGSVQPGMNTTPTGPFGSPAPNTRQVAATGGGSGMPNIPGPTVPADPRLGFQPQGLSGLPAPGSLSRFADGFKMADSTQTGAIMPGVSGSAFPADPRLGIPPQGLSGLVASLPDIAGAPTAPFGAIDPRVGNYLSANNYIDLTGGPNSAVDTGVAYDQPQPQQDDAADEPAMFDEQLEPIIDAWRQAEEEAGPILNRNFKAAMQRGRWGGEGGAGQINRPGYGSEDGETPPPPPSGRLQNNDAWDGISRDGNWKWDAEAKKWVRNTTDDTDTEPGGNDNPAIPVGTIAPNGLMWTGKAWVWSPQSARFPQYSQMWAFGPPVRA